MKQKLVIIVFIALVFSSLYYFLNQEDTVYHRKAMSYKDKLIFAEKKPDVEEEIIENVNNNGIIKVKLELKQSVQENDYFCVPAALQMVLDFKNITISQSDLAEELNTSKTTGTEYVDLARVANKHLFNDQVGYQVQTLDINKITDQEKLDFEQRIIQNISTNDPTFVAIDNKAMYETLSVGNHMVVVIGYSLNTKTDKIESYIFIDPSYVVQDSQMQGLKVVSSENMIKAIIQNEEPAYVY